MIYKTNYWMTRKDSDLIRIAQHIGLYIVPEKEKGGHLKYIIKYHMQVQEERHPEYTDKNSGHCIVLLYRKYYTRIYKTKTIVPEIVVAPAVPVQKKEENNDEQSMMFIIFVT